MYSMLGGTAELLSPGLCCNDHNCSEEEKGGPERATGSVVNNNQIIIWPKGAPALFEVGLDSEGDDMKQLNNAERTGADVYPLQVSSLCYSDFCIPVLKSLTIRRLQPLAKIAEASVSFIFQLVIRAFKADGICLMTL